MIYVKYELNFLMLCNRTLCFKLLISVLLRYMLYVALIRYVRNPVAFLNVVQEFIEGARTLNGLYHLEQKQEK
jgi:hypothetical protein